MLEQHPLGYCQKETPRSLSLIIKSNKSVTRGAPLVPIGLSINCLCNFEPNLINILFK